MASRARITRTGRVLEDTFFKQAKSAGYVARSAYKLLEIQEKHKLIGPGMRVLDLGCHPGAWLQVACQSLGPASKGGLVLGVDLQATKRPDKYCDDRVRIFQADARLLPPDFWQQQCPGGFDTVLSDMCHFTLGNSVADAFKSLELARTAWAIATGGEEAADAAAPGVQQAAPGGRLVPHAAAAPAAVAAAVPVAAGSLAPEPALQGLHAGVLKPGGSLVMKLLQGPGTQEFAAELRRDFGKVAWHRPKATRSESKEVFLLGLKRR